MYTQIVIMIIVVIKPIELSVIMIAEDGYWCLEFWLKRGRDAAATKNLCLQRDDEPV